MNFHLQFSIPPFPEKINYSHSSLFMGSCFAEEIGGKMLQYKFNGLINPHGILYNPSSMSVALRRYIDNKALEENELFFANECWNSWEHHSRFSDSDKQTCLNEINESISASYYVLKKAEWLFITFGSAYIYKRNDSSLLVGNCHKQPQKGFTKHLLSATEITDDYNLLIRQLKKLNSKLKIVFTVSPVRYIRDGVVENNLSKAHLLESVHQLKGQHDNVFYFPAYELMMDDLRDYRFYKSDLVHPNGQAIDYIFEKLRSTVFDVETISLFEKIKEIITARHHLPFNVETEAFRKFLSVYQERCIGLQKKYPNLNFKEEIDHFSLES